MIAHDIEEARRVLLERVRALVPTVEPAAVRGDYYVRVAAAALTADQAHGTWRANLVDLPITGWQIDPAPPELAAADSYGIYQVDELRRQRALFVVPLVLPDRWSFYCDHQTLVEVMSPVGEVVPVGLRVGKPET